MLYYATGTELDKLTMYSLAYHLLCEIRHIGTSFSSWISYLYPTCLYLMSRTSSVCTDLNQDVGTHICVCLKHRLLVMIRVVKLIEIGCWYSGQPRPLIANPLMPSEKQMTKVTIKQSCIIEAVSSVGPIVSLESAWHIVT